MFCKPKPNGICIYQGSIAISLIRHSKSTPIVILNPIMALQVLFLSIQMPLLNYQCCKVRVEISYIALPNIAIRAFYNYGCTTYFPACTDLCAMRTYTLHQPMCRANLCSKPTHALCQKSCQHNLGHPISWPCTFTNLHQISLSKPT